MGDLEFAQGFKLDQKIDSLVNSNVNNMSRHWAIDLATSTKVANENRRALCHDSFASWFNDGVLETLRFTLEGIKSRSISREETLAICKWL